MVKIRGENSRNSSALLEVDAGVGESGWDRSESTVNVMGENCKRASFLCVYKSTLIWIGICLLVAFTCAMVPSAFLLAKANDCSSVKSQNSKLDRTNDILLQQAENYSSTVSKLSNQLLAMQDTLKLMNEKMQVQKDSMTDYFGVTFTTHSNRSMEYAMVIMPDRITWNQADLFCKSIQSELAYPNADIYSSVDDLKDSCPFTPSTNCCACWVGLTKQYEDGDWQTSDGEAAVTTEKMWAPGQEYVKKHPDYDCAYIFNGLLYSMYCDGNASQNHSTTVVADRFVCQTLLSF